jgi:hypothetical protein
LNQSISIDSNSHTCLIEAVCPDYDPEKDNSGLFEERRSMIRILLYNHQPFYVLPTVQTEYKRIKNLNWMEEHEEFTKMLLLDYIQKLDNNRIAMRKKTFLYYHNKEMDCQILAEAEDARMDILLSCDKKFIKRLGSRALNVKIVKPTEYLQRLNISPGTRPIWRPAPSNPLSNKKWWQI